MSWPSAIRRNRRGFTLIELLVVIGIIAVLSAVLLAGLGGGKSVSLQAAQAQLTNLVTAARSKAMTTGRRTRILVNIDALASPDRFLRYVVYQHARESGADPENWDTIWSLSMPDDIYIIPSSITSADGLVFDLNEWTRISDPSARLSSDALAQTAQLTIAGDQAAQQWAGFVFTTNGTLARLTSAYPLPPKGAIILTVGESRPPGSFAAGSSPIRLISPQSVRGLSISVYGIPALLNDRASF